MKMEHFIRMALWIFIVSATFSIGYPTPLSFRNFYIRRMEEEVKCLADSKFYTPQNVKDKCIKGVMECFLKELNTTRRECEDKNDRISEAIYSLQNLLNVTTSGNDSAPSIPDECTCESYPQTDFKDFLNEYKTWIQRQNNISRR